MKSKLELACFNLESAIMAAAAGVHRIEFCAGYSVGGITPSEEDLLVLKEKVTIPVFLMIRTRPGNFVYSASEISEMQNTIQKFGALGADGFVFGALTPDHKIDEKANRELLAAAGNIPCTFHRAFDQTDDPLKALDLLIRLGFENVLTSGRQSTALAGAEMLRQLQAHAQKRIEIIAGGGVRSTNIKNLLQKFPSDFYHSSAIVDQGDVADLQEIKNLLSNLGW